jgi:hypothetical protein
MLGIMVPPRVGSYSQSHGGNDSDHPLNLILPNAGSASFLGRYFPGLTEAMSLIEV